MSISFTIKSDGINIKSFIEGEKTQINNGMVRIGKLIKERMHNEIKSRRKRKGFTNNLISAIRLDVINDRDGTFVGIGEKSVLNKEAKYWYVVNYGKKFTGEIFIPPTTTGSFEGSAPSAGVNNQRFGQHSPGFLMKPKTFRPLHYIERTNAWLINYWSEYWNRILT